MVERTRTELGPAEVVAALRLKEGLLGHQEASKFFSPYADMLSERETVRDIFDGFAQVENPRERRVIRIQLDKWVEMWTRNSTSEVSTCLRAELVRFMNNTNSNGH
jgi:hypothetical protein